MSGTPQNPVVLAPDSSPTAKQDAHAKHPGGYGDGAGTQPNTFLQNLQAYQYQQPAPFMSTASTPSVGTSSAPSDSILQIKATRLSRLFSSYTVEQCMDVLRASNYDLGEAIEKLRPKKVAPPPPPPVSTHQTPFPAPAPAPAPVPRPSAPPKRPAKRKARAMSDSDSDGSILSLIHI